MPNKPRRDYANDTQSSSEIVIRAPDNIAEDGWRFHVDFSFPTTCTQVGSIGPGKLPLRRFEFWNDEKSPMNSLTRRTDLSLVADIQKTAIISSRLLRVSPVNRREPATCDSSAGNLIHSNCDHFLY